MPLTLLAILLAFAAPAPFAEAAAALEDDAILELCRAGRPQGRRGASPARPVETAAPRRSLPQDSSELRSRPSDGWTPRLFSRPPPL